jgi:hypothetical protein
MAKIKTVATFDGKGVVRGTRQMTRSVEKFGASVRKIGGWMAAAFSVHAIINYTKETIKLGSEIFHAAQQAKLSTDAYQALRIVFEEAGSDASRLTSVLARLETSQARALAGEKTQADAWRRIGLSIDEVKGKRPEELLSDLARKFNENADSAELARGIYEVFGTRSVPALNEVLKNLGEDGLQVTIDKFKEMNQIIDEDSLAAMAQLEDQTGRVFRKIRVWALKGVRATSEFYDAYTRALTELKSPDIRLSPGSFKDLFRAAKAEIGKEREEEIKRIKEAFSAPPPTDDPMGIQSAIRASASGRRRIGGAGLAGGEDVASLDMRRNAILEDMFRAMDEFYKEDREFQRALLSVMTDSRDLPE